MTHVDVRWVNARELSDDEFDATLRLRQAIDLRIDPHLEPTQAAELAAYLRNDRTERARHERIVGFDGSTAVAIGHIDFTWDVNNLGFSSLEIDMGENDDGLGRTTLARLLDLADADSRTSILGWGRDTPWRRAFWDRLGAPLRYTERYSEIDLGAVDGELMQAWIDRRTERAASFQLVSWAGICPDPWIGAYVGTLNAMNDAPIDDLDIEDVVVGADDVAEVCESFQAVGLRMVAIMALTEQGEPAAMTSILLNDYRADGSWQWETVVLEPFRNRGIGRWIKAAMWQRLRRDYPNIQTLRTGNAESNAAMLAINVQMGYRPTHTYGAWQTDIDTLRRNLAGPDQHG